MLTKTQEQINLKEFKEKVINDYRTVSLSREISVMGRRDVLSGKGKFGIFGDGKELPQVVLSHFFKNGDYRSGYYRDGTLLLAQELLSPREIFSTVYGHADVTYERMSGGRQMAGHFLSEMINSSKEWINQTNIKNHISDVSPLATQMSRLVGLGLASKIYRYNKIKNSSKFSNNGNEIVWGSIGNASTSQGVFFESVNACGVLQIPAIISIWDDEYGISVDNKYHTTKESISKALSGFKLTKNQSGIEILKVKGWDYASLMKTYSYAENIARNYHVPVIIHVTELTQPLGHSTSGSHERYKSKERLDWEKSNDCNLKFKEWIIENKLCSQKKLQNIDNEIKKYVTEEKRLAWEYYQRPFLKSRDELLDIFNLFENDYIKSELKKKVESLEEVNFSELLKISRNTIYDLDSSNDIIKNKLLEWNKSKMKLLSEKYSTDLYSIDINDLLKKNFTPPAYDNSNEVDGRIILRDNFDELLKNHDNLFIFGEDVGKIGDVNQGLEGLQKKYGKNRVFDTGIRESTIVGQAIGMALRGLKPIAEIQYLDYILYALQILSDDVATMSYRTHGRQKAPIIIRTRGHRLEGIWHAGSPLGGMINFLRGILILTPRNMTKAAGFYNSLVKLDQPAIVIEPLNGYRTKEKIPSNLGKLETPIGEVDIIKKGKDLTIISYGSTLNIVEKVGQKLLDYDIDCEIIDLQSLIPFDISHRIKKSVEKTNRILIVDEDMPGGASSYILQELLNTQKIYNKLDSEPNLLTAKEHRPPYGSDGDYSSKPSFEDIFEKVYEIMNEVDPNKYSNI
jgi:pyruvate/2-oxoglutarate/acetoin dehydrogenase E1 component/TPP-dependent pyruvate/acetoin dehydrogenase alpha subunit